MIFEVSFDRERMYKMKRITAALLAILMLLAGLVSCADDGDKDDTTGTDTSADTEADAGMTQEEMHAALEKLNVSDYIKLGAYVGVEIEEVTVEVTDKIIENTIKEFLKEYAEEYKLTESDKAENGDTLVITYVGYIDEEKTDKFENGEKFTEATTGSDLELGSGSFIPGFEDALVGHSVGETVTFNVVFPDDYKNNPDLSGVNTKFEVYIRSGVRMISPEYTDELVAEKTDYETVEEHKAYLIEELHKAAKEKEHSSKVSAAWEKIIKASEVIKYPEELLNAAVSLTISQYESYAAQYKLSLEQLLSLYYGITTEKFKEQVTDECKDYIVEELILIEIIRKEKLEINDREYAEAAKEYADKFGLESVEKLEEEYGADVVKENIQWDKVCNFLLENAVIVPASESDSDKAE